MKYSVTIEIDKEEILKILKNPCCESCSRITVMEYIYGLVEEAEVLERVPLPP